MSDEIFFDGVRYISAGDAASESGFTRDYIALLCRHGKVRGRRVGRGWYVEQPSLKEFLSLQDYAKSKRKAELVEERVREYHGIGDGIRPTVEETPFDEVGGVVHTSGEGVAVEHALVSERAHALQSQMKTAVARHGLRASHAAAQMAAAPAGVGFEVARLSTPHIPLYAVSPLLEFVHKVVALVVAFMLTFGTYAAVDRDTARFAAYALRDTADSIAQEYRALTNGGVRQVVSRIESRVAAAVENPRGTLASASSAFPSILASIARAVNERVNSFVYAIAFPDSITDPGGVVAIEIESYKAPRQSSAPIAAATSTTVPAPRPIYTGTPSTTASEPITERVVERVVETERIVTQGGITEEILAARLQELDNKFTSKLYGAVSSVST
ncbi:MAG TPA: hypothetical protein VJL39_01645, partial [Candidatus Paceibacterota bacterium]